MNEPGSTVGVSDDVAPTPATGRPPAKRPAKPPKGPKAAKASKAAKTPKPTKGPKAASGARLPEAVPADPDPAPSDRTATAWGGALATLALAWLAAMMGAAHAHITGAPDRDQALSRAAMDLPVVVTASLVAGCAIGLVTAELLGRWPAPAARRPVARLVAALGGGLTVGAGCLGLLLNQYGDGGTAFGAGAAALLGGALGGLRPARVVGAALTGFLAWVAVGFLKGFFDGQLLQLFGAGESLSAQVRAASWLSLTVSLVGGLVAGLVAYAFLRRGGAGLRWPAYLVAGAGAGALLLLAELATQVGGARLLAAAGNLGPLDAAALAYQRSERVNTALIMLFVGAVTAIVAFGRTLKPPRP